MRSSVAPLLGLLLLAACQTPPPESGSPVRSDIFEDLPVPKGAVYIHRNHESFSYRGETFRCGKFLFEYQGDHAATVAFFRDTMTRPPYSWTLEQEDTAGQGTATLVFRKGDDRCTIDIDYVPSPSIEKPNNQRILIRLNYRR